MEARLYAEDPAKGFLPSIGRLDHLQLGEWRGWAIYAPESRAPSFPRIETGVEQGSEVSPFYDPMIAKIVTHQNDRYAAADALARACDGVTTWPVRNNAGFLSALLRDETFRSGQATTNYIGDAADQLLRSAEPSESLLAAASSHLFREAGGGHAAIDPEDWPHKPGEVWSDLLGFRLNGPVRATMWLKVDGALRESTIGTVATGDAAAGETIFGTDDGVVIVERGWPHHVQAARVDGGGSAAAADGAILAPMPGRVIAVDVAAGDTVTKGQKLVTLEAMKMEHALVAPFDGIVGELNATEGGQVTEGATLVRIEKPE
jgi:3-methylcrotonyl-CoA carboxylase alpha subunit